MISTIERMVDVAAIVSNGVTYGKPNMTALDGDLGRRIIKTILTAPRPDPAELERTCAEVNAKIQEARDNGTF